MRTRTLAGLAAATALASGGIAVGTLGGAGASNAAMSRGWPAVAKGATQNITTGRTLRIVTHEERARVIDVGRQGNSPGDYSVFEETLRDRSGNVTGRDAATCLNMVTTTRCSATFAIAGKGTIEIAGALLVRGTYSFTITGGTGAYQNARGEATITGGEGGDTDFTFSLIP